jgi:predicted DNA-binding antitoxin AbrB/MazE fold protein
MSQVQELIQKIEKVGGSVQLKDGDRLRIEAPRGSLTSEIKDALTLSKKEIIKELKNTQEACKPYIDEHGILAIPFNCNPRFWWWAGWWAGGQTILETLRELRAPNEMIAKYGPGGAA